MAIKTAHKFFVETIEDFAAEGPLINLHLEEAEKADNGDWLITFGHDRKTSNPLSRLGIPGEATERVYRQVRIDRHTGEPQAITIRSL